VLALLGRPGPLGGQPTPAVPDLWGALGAMGLPPDQLLLYAENFYRRFPEEFLALGAPGLEDIYDLRLHGTRCRRIVETPSERIVEIAIRRWAHTLVPAGPAYAHSPFAGHQGCPHAPASYGHPGCAAYPQHPACAGGLAAPSSAVAEGLGAAAPFAQAGAAGPGDGHQRHGAGPPQQPGHWALDAAASAQLSRLEAAVQLLQPQLDMLVGQVGEPRAQPGAQAAESAASPSPDSAAGAEPGEAANSMRLRRQLGQLHINSSRPAPSSQAVVELQAQGPVHPVPERAEEKGAAARPRAEPAVDVTAAPESHGSRAPRPANVRPMRLARDAEDPESPRSPGRFSAWK
ncbi:unnamed protein product, partial [Prorocentrum cordatum]